MDDHGRNTYVAIVRDFLQGYIRFHRVNVFISFTSIINLNATDPSKSWLVRPPFKVNRRQDSCAIYLPRFSWIYCIKIRVHFLAYWLFYVAFKLFEFLSINIHSCLKRLSEFKDIQDNIRHVCGLPSQGSDYTSNILLPVWYSCLVSRTKHAVRKAKQRSQDKYQQIGGK